MQGTILALKEVSCICTRAAVKKWVYQSLLLFRGRTHGSTSEFSVPQWPAEPCPLGGYSSAVSESCPGHWGTDTWRLIFLWILPGVWHLWGSLASAIGTTPLGVHCCSAGAQHMALCCTEASVIWGCWRREPPWSSGGLSCTLTVACVVGLVVFWPQDKSVQLSWLCRKQMANSCNNSFSSYQFNWLSLQVVIAKSDLREGGNR